MKILQEYTLGELCAQYWLSEDTGAISLELLPAGMQAWRRPKKETGDSLVQCRVRGSAFPFGFSNGHTMRNSAFLEGFSLVSQTKTETEKALEILTTLSNAEGQTLLHRLIYPVKAPGVIVRTAYRNKGAQPVTLEMLSSFSLAGLTPFVEGDAPNTLLLHRLRSKWSNEARLCTDTVEALQLEPSWSGYGANSEKFGQIGSFPARRFFPFAAVEDCQTQVVWGARLGCAASWQIEAYRRDDGLCLSGGLADYDFGHWSKEVAPGQCFEAPPAYLSVCSGTLDDVCSNLVALEEMAAGVSLNQNAFPVIFNEFCTTWGTPSEQAVLNQLAALRGKDVDYFVIDCGWYADPVKGWERNTGDWEVNAAQFPHGLAPVSAAIRAAGMLPGIWFEPEICGVDSAAFSQTDHLLKRFGTPITAGYRRFWNMRDPFVRDYLQKKVMDFIKENNFAYVKLDNNESIGTGCDGAESLGEGLRLNAQASVEFLQQLHVALPNVAVELCASGGHRLSPPFLAACRFASCSDAHEEKELPIIAANLHRVLAPRQNLIWAVLRKEDSTVRLVWSLCATFLGVMCLSGDVCALNTEQWCVVKEGIAFYRAAAPLLQNGRTVRYGPAVSSYRHPDGWQALERVSPDEKEMLIVVHIFKCVSGGFRIPLKNSCHLIKAFSDSADKFSLKNGVLSVSSQTDGAFALLLRSD